MVIIVGYKKRVGKDEFYKTVKERFPELNVYRVAFADPLKEEIFERFLKQDGYDIGVLDNPETKPIFRPFMQWYGTEYRRNPILGGDPDYWIKKAFQKVDEIQSKDPNAIIIFCDGRYPNEIAAVKNRGGFAVKINRGSVFDPNEQHTSETALDTYAEFDYVIENESSLEDYKNKVQNLINHLLYAKVFE
jgi:hypothetical protein